MRPYLLWCFGLLLAGLSLGVNPVLGQDQGATLFFDDFNYTRYDDASFVENGWIVRTGEGWPGVPGAIWRASNVSFVNDPDQDGNRLLKMASSTDSDRVYQTQVCHQRKYYEGTYAVRVQFSDAPNYGPDGDQVVETFYLISPPGEPMDPDYSELDYEYLPNGGWGNRDSVLFMVSWETFQLDPWIAVNDSGAVSRSFEGWHTLVIQIGDGEINYFVDGRWEAGHGADFYPEVPMSINFNLWFVNGGLVPSRLLRKYVERVDWVFHAQDQILSPDEVRAQVETLRDDGVTFTDTVPQWQPPLDSPCNF
jgi:hypothetical protein